MVANLKIYDELLALSPFDYLSYFHKRPKKKKNYAVCERETCSELTAGEMAPISLKACRNVEMLYFCDLSWGSAGGVWVLNSCSPVHWEPNDFISLHTHTQMLCVGQMFLSRCQRHRHLPHLPFTQTFCPSCPALFRITFIIFLAWGAVVYSVVSIRNIQLVPVL